jgi:hypothetical protein
MGTSPRRVVAPPVYEWSTLVAAFIVRFMHELIEAKVLDFEADSADRLRDAFTRYGFDVKIMPILPWQEGAGTYIGWPTLLAVPVDLFLKAFAEGSGLRLKQFAIDLHHDRAGTSQIKKWVLAIRESGDREFSLYLTDSLPDEAYVQLFDIDTGQYPSGSLHWDSREGHGWLFTPRVDKQ